MELSKINYLAASLCEKAYDTPSALLLGAVNNPAHITGAQYGADVFIFEGFEFNFLIVRGTEVNRDVGFREALSALRFSRRKVEGGDQQLGIHRGFYNAYHEISDIIGEEVLQLRLEQVHEGREKPWVFCGHSAGGAIASICAAVLHPEYLITSGAPRYAGKNFAESLNKTKVFRWVNSSDWVPRFPFGFGYRHHGEQIFVSCTGEVLNNPSAFRSGISLIADLGNSGINHSVLAYMFAAAAINYEVTDEDN